MSLRDKLLQELRGPKSPSTISSNHADEALVEPGTPMPAPPSPPVAHPPGSCSRCGSTLFSYPGGAGKRCQGCGTQTDVVHSNGVKRSELDTFSGGRMKMNPVPFFMALARIRGFGGR
jgi:hypothetical protein